MKFLLLAARIGIWTSSKCHVRIAESSFTSRASDIKWGSCFRSAWIICSPASFARRLVLKSTDERRRPCLKCALPPLRTCRGRRWRMEHRGISSAGTRKSFRSLKPIGNQSRLWVARQPTDGSRRSTRPFSPTRASLFPKTMVVTCCTASSKRISRWSSRNTRKFNKTVSEHYHDNVHVNKTLGWAYIAQCFSSSAAKFLLIVSSPQKSLIEKDFSLILLSFVHQIVLT